MDREIILDRYRALMEEVKWRVQVINSAHTLPFPRPAPAIELSYLQLRMICEAIALGCLLVHGDIPQSRTGRLKKEYHAGRIINALEKLHPTFFPVPFKILFDRHNKPWSFVDEDQTNTLDKASLLSLYYECDKFLHRSNLAFVLPGRPRTVKIERIHDWVVKINTFLHNHRISLLDGKYELWINMHGPEGYASGYFARNTGKSVLGFGI